MTSVAACTRRHLLHRGLDAAAIGVLVLTGTRARAAGVRSLAMMHTHTGEHIDVVYAIDECYQMPLAC